MSIIESVEVYRAARDGTAQVRALRPTVTKGGRSAGDKRSLNSGRDDGGGFLNVRPNWAGFPQNP